MKKKLPKQEKQILLQALGKGYREEYLQANPHGFCKSSTKTKNAKVYDRKKDWF